MPACRGEDTDGVSYRRGDRLNELKEEISQVKIDIEKAERDYELNTAAELKYEKLPRLELESKRLEELANDEQSKKVKRCSVMKLLLKISLMWLLSGQAFLHRSLLKRSASVS
jgi:hypothetical protein